MSSSMVDKCNDKIKEHNITPEELVAAEKDAQIAWDVFCQDFSKWDSYMSKQGNKLFYVILQVMVNRSRK